MALQDPSGVSVIDGMGAIGKPKETFRVYGEGSQREDKVTRHYTLMRENQTVAFVERMEAKVVGGFSPSASGSLEGAIGCRVSGYKYTRRLHLCIINGLVSALVGAC